MLDDDARDNLTQHYIDGALEHMKEHAKEQTRQDNMVNKLSVEDGLRRVFELGDVIESDPVLVAIHGHGNCGKTYVADRLYRMCQERGLVAHRELSDDLHTLSTLPHYVLLEDYLYSPKDDNDAKRIFGKGIDMRVLVDNPTVTGNVLPYLPDVKFDIVIHNPHSYRK